MTPTVIEYRGDPKRYVSVILGAIDRGRLTYNGDANCEQTFRSLSSVIEMCIRDRSETGTDITIDEAGMYRIELDLSTPFYDYTITR